MLTLQTFYTRKVVLKGDKILIQLMSHVSCFFGRQDNAYCTLLTTPAPVIAPESEHAHFILHTERCTLLTTCLYCIWKFYHLTLQRYNICQSWSQDLLGNMYLDISPQVSKSIRTLFSGFLNLWVS